MMPMHLLADDTLLPHVDACGLAALGLLATLAWWLVAWLFIRSAVRSGTLSALRIHRRETAGRPFIHQQAPPRQYPQQQAYAPNWPTNAAGQYAPPPPGQFDIVDDTDQA